MNDIWIASQLLAGTITVVIGMIVLLVMMYFSDKKQDADRKDELEALKKENELLIKNLEYSIKNFSSNNEVRDVINEIASRLKQRG